MEPTYYIWNARLGGWATHNAQYSTDFAQAFAFGRSEAITRCKRAGGLTLLPILADDIAAVRK